MMWCESGQTLLFLQEQDPHYHHSRCLQELRLKNSTVTVVIEKGNELKEQLTPKWLTFWFTESTGNKSSINSLKPTFHHKAEN